MEESRGLFELSVQQDVYPAPNDDPKAVDWLPLFAGFSWLAYGAQFSVVVTMAPSPSNKGEAAMGGFFHEVLLTDCPKEDGRGREWVTSVGWAPSGPSLGMLAAVAGRHIYLYAPQGLSEVQNTKQKWPEVPLRWLNVQVLEHRTEVRSVAWTESGDGLLSVGPEIVMWQQGEQTWKCLWRSNLEHPHTLCAASWSARGIAATAEGTHSGPGVEEDEYDHLVKVWWWEDGQDLQVLELSHPDELLSIQWRPLRGFSSSSQPFRPVLLTCCRDGVVRLWTEIGSFGTKIGSAAVDQGMNGYQNQFKLAFFVSAVIDVNSTLKGALGQDIFITWPEARGGSPRTLAVPVDTSNITPGKESDNASSEWLLGVGPSGSVTLWSVQSLDDLSPSRGQFVQLWQQRPSLLSCPCIPASESSVSPEDRGRLLAMKAVVHRPYGTLWGPPSSLEVFEIWSDNLLQWSCIWPHVSALGARSSVTGIVATGVPSTVAGSGKFSAWGVSSELMHLDGHRGSVLQTAVHPDAAMRLVASLDDLGTVLFWLSSSSPSNPRLEIAGYSNSLWKLSGRLTGHNVNCGGSFTSMAWAPVAPAGADAVLLLAYPQGVDCYAISERVISNKGKPKSFTISHSLICTLYWPFLVTGDTLQGIYTSPSLAAFDENSQVRSCVVVGVGGMGMRLVSWEVNIKVSPGEQPESLKSEEIVASHSMKENMAEISSVSSSKDDEDVDDVDEVYSSETADVVESKREKTVVEGHLLGYTTLQVEEHVISMAVSTPQHISFGSSEGRRRTLSDFEQVFDVITGCVDGVIRLWKVGVIESESSCNLADKSRSWRCVGSLRLYNGPVTGVAVCNGGATVASSGLTTDGVDTCVHVWGADTFMEEKGFSLEGSLVLPDAVVSLSWLEGGSGLPVLGVATRGSITLFAQCRTSGSESSSGLSESGVWACLASSSLNGITASSLSWETQGSLVVTCEGHILIYSNCVWTPASAELCSSVEDISSAVSHLVVHDGFFLNFPRPSASLLPPPKNQQSVPRVPEFEHDQGNGFCSILEAAEKIGFSVLDYHPAAVLSWLSRGYRGCARACIRHLAKFLSPRREPPSRGLYGQSFTTPAEPPKLTIPRTPLTKMFQEDEQHDEGGGIQNGRTSFGPFGGTEGHGGNLAENFLSTYSKDLLGDFTVTPNGQSWRKEKMEAKDCSQIRTGGLQPFTETEVDLISRIIRDSPEVPGLSDGNEKLQLLALINVLAEIDGGQPSPIESLDPPGQRFWLAFRYSFHYTRWAKELHYVAGELGVDSKAMAWALQSEAKQTLVDLCLPTQASTWSVMRGLGMGFWYTDTIQLRKTMEKVARTHYLEKRDPKDCTLLYVALDRRSVLAGLFKVSRDQRDKPLADFLARDFQEERHKVAALKNAYVLMGKHRHELAAAFFILGQDINSAAVICAKNMGDPQLALTICLLLEGSNGPVGRDMILKYALPAARQAGDGWLASLLQWLLGKGIESIRELRTQKRSSQPPVLKEMASSSPASEKDCFVLPLDPDVGSYCTLLAAKPRIRSGGDAEEAVSLAKVATTRSAFALKRSGLSLHVLEYLRNVQPVNKTQVGSSFNLTNFDHGASTAFGRSSPASELPLTDATGREVGLGWVSADVVAGIQRKIRASLALQCASQLLQDHPYWGGQTCAAWQDPVMSKVVFRQMQYTGKGGDVYKYREDENQAVDNLDGEWSLLTFVEEADKNFDGDVKLLERKYLVDVNWVVASLSTFARIHHRPYLLDRLIQGIGIMRDFHLATKAALSASAARYLQSAATEAPWVLARAVLACGGAASPMPSKLEILKIAGGRVSAGEDVDFQGGVLSQLQMEELVRFGGEVQLFTTAASQENSLKEKGSQFMNLLSFVYFVAAAWLGRQTKTLLGLIGPTLLDPSAEPVVPSRELDAVTWFRKLEGNGVNSARHAAGKRPLEPFDFNIAGIVNITADDAWRVLGVALWTHLLIYIKKQLTGTAVEVPYSSFGRVSSTHPQSRLKTTIQSAIQSNVSTAPVSRGSSFLGFSFQSSTWFDFKPKARDNSTQPPYVNLARTSSNGSFESVPSTSRSSAAAAGVTSETDEFDAALLGSLTSIVAGLRKELAAHLQHTLNVSNAEPLSLWLWGKPPSVSGVKSNVAGGSGSSKAFGASSSSTVVGGPAAKNANLTSVQKSNMFPTAEIEIEDEACKELWNMLVVREKVCSALGLEGVSGPKNKQEEGEMSGWYFGRKGSVLPPSGQSTGSDRDVNITGKLPPMRIMWNTTKDGTSVSCEGVGVSAQRQEASSHSRPQASVEGLHLSEEFSEADFEYHSATVKKFSATPWHPGPDALVKASVLPNLLYNDSVRQRSR